MLDFMGSGVALQYNRGVLHSAPRTNTVITSACLALIINKTDTKRVVNPPWIGRHCDFREEKSEVNGYLFDQYDYT